MAEEEEGEDRSVVVAEEGEVVMRVGGVTMRVDGLPASDDDGEIESEDDFLAVVVVVDAVAAVELF